MTLTVSGPAGGHFEQETTVVRILVLADDNGVGREAAHPLAQVRQELERSRR